MTLVLAMAMEAAIKKYTMNLEIEKAAAVQREWKMLLDIKPTPKSTIDSIEAMDGHVILNSQKEAIYVFFDTAEPKSGVTDADLKRLNGLKGLKRLSFENAGHKITDAGLEHLKGLTSLEYVSLFSNKITIAGLTHLLELPRLIGLGLENTNITDAGLVHLKGLTKLRSLSLGNTKVTAAGIRKLRQALPKCNVLGEKISD